MRTEFRIVGSFVIAYIIRSVLMALFSYSFLSYARVYACIVCIILIVNFSRDNPSSSEGETGTVREEWIVDGSGSRVRLFDPSNYPDFKLIGKETEGNIYSSSEGELITTVIVTKAGSSADDSSDTIIALAALVFIICVLSLVITGIPGIVKNRVGETNNSTSESYASNDDNHEGDSTEKQPNNNRQSREDIVSANDGSHGNPEATYKEEPQEERPVSLKDYGIFKDGHGISSSDYVFADSDKRNLTDSDVDLLTLRGINYAKNELYARHGRKFKSEELQEFFNSRDWYYGYLAAEPASDKIIKEEFNSYEKYNSDFLAGIESSMGMYQLDQ